MSTNEEMTSMQMNLYMNVGDQLRLINMFHTFHASEFGNKQICPYGHDF